MTTFRHNSKFAFANAQVPVRHHDLTNRRGLADNRPHQSFWDRSSITEGALLLPRLTISSSSGTSFMDEVGFYCGTKGDGLWDGKAG